MKKENTRICVEVLDLSISKDRTRDLQGNYNHYQFWNGNIEIYHPHTCDAAVLRRRTEEDKIFQLLASLSYNFEDLRSHILMNLELPSLQSITAMVQH